MEGLSNAFKDLNRWQIGFLVAVVVASFGATYGVYAFVSSSGERGLEENQRSYTRSDGQSGQPGRDRWQHRLFQQGDAELRVSGHYLGDSGGGGTRGNERPISGQARQ